MSEVKHIHHIKKIKQTVQFMINIIAILSYIYETVYINIRYNNRVSEENLHGRVKIISVNTVIDLA